MKAAGITAEYNPLHNGHVYHIEETRRASGCDAVVVAMSGDYVQRGEPAIMNKWVRTEHALRSGADLVLEIPVLFCLGNAGQYAGAAVRILEATGKVSHISFGSESGDMDALLRIAGTFRESKDEIEKAVKSMRGLGLSYPAARAHAYSEVRAAVKGSDPDTDPEILGDMRMLNDPNDILAIGGVRNFIIGILAVEKAEALVMLGGEYHVFHAGRLSLFGPFLGIQQVGVEMVKIPLIILVGDFFAGLDPFVPCGQGVKTEMDKHSEPIVGKPGGITGSWAGNVRRHLDFLLEMC